MAEEAYRTCSTYSPSIFFPSEALLRVFGSFPGLGALFLFLGTLHTSRNHSNGSINTEIPSSEPSERAGVFGFYLLGPLLGPTIGPVLGAVVLEYLSWPWIFWVLFIICSVAILGAFFFLRETYAPTILAKRKQELEASTGTRYYYVGEDSRPLRIKLVESFKRPLRILFTQPIVMTMAAYQALIFAITFSLYTQFQVSRSIPLRTSVQDRVRGSLDFSNSGTGLVLTKSSQFGVAFMVSPLCRSDSLI